MSNYDRSAMIEEANELGLEFKGNISNAKLSEMIAEAKGEPPPIDETPPPSPASKPDVAEEDNLLANAAAVEMRRVRERQKRLREGVADIKKRAMKTQIVTITNKDVREADKVTTAYLSVQNQYFAVARNVPLDIPVELEQCLINAAESCMMTMHKDEIVKGQRTGNKVSVRVKKYAVSYTGQKPD